MSYDSRAAILYDLNNQPFEVRDGVAIPAGTSGILNYGTDAGTARIILLDAAGRQIVVGAAADGAAPTGNPVLVAGQDGANAQSLLTDTLGRLNIVGAAAEGAAVTGNPVRTGAEDGAGNIVTVRAGVTTGDVSPAGVAGYLNNLAMGQFLTAPPALTDTHFQFLQLDGVGNLRVTGTFTSNFVSTEVWTAAAVAAGGTSLSVNVQATPFLSVFGNSSAETIITLQFSDDNIAFFDAVTTHVTGGGGDFEISRTIGARWTRLTSSAAATITAFISAKD